MNAGMYIRMGSKLCLLIMIFSFSSGCGNRDDIDGFINVDVTDLNQKIKQGVQDKEAWVETPFLIVNKLFGPEYNSESRRTFIFEQYEQGNLLTVMVTQDGLPDDSVAGEKRIIEFNFVNGVWQLSKMRLGLKCRKHRGHVNYSGEACD